MWHVSCIFLLATAAASEWPWESTESTPNFINPNSSRECGIIPKLNRQKCDSAEPTETFFGQYPWQAAIVVRPSYTFLCSGVLVSNDAVVTSASCITNPLQSRDFPGIGSIRIRLGDWDISQHNRPLLEPFQHLEMPLERVVVHPGYDPSMAIPRFDIAVLLLADRIQWDEYPHIAPACLPDPQMVVDLTRVNCWMAGWAQSPPTFFQDCCSGRLVRRGSPTKTNQPRAPVAEETSFDDSEKPDAQFGSNKFTQERFPSHFDSFRRSREDGEQQKGRMTRDAQDATTEESDALPNRNDTRDRRQAPPRGDIPIEADDTPRSFFSSLVSTPSRLLHHSQVILLGPRRCSRRLRRPLGDDVFCAVEWSNQQPVCIADAGAGIVCELPSPGVTTAQPWRQKRQAEFDTSLFRVSTPPMPPNERRVQVTLVGVVARPALCQPEEVVVATDLFEMFQFVATQIAMRPRF